MAMVIACVRSRAPSFCRIAFTCAFTVPSLTKSDFRDLEVRLSLGDAAEHFLLAWRERFRRNMVRELGRDFGRDLLATGMHRANRLGEPGRVHVLQEVARCAGAKAAEDFLVRVVRGEQDDARVGFRSRMACVSCTPSMGLMRRSTIATSGVRLLNWSSAVCSVAGLANHLEAVDGVQDRRETLTKDRVVVDEEDPDILSSHGRLARVPTWLVAASSSPSTGINEHFPARPLFADGVHPVSANAFPERYGDHKLRCEVRLGQWQTQKKARIRAAPKPWNWRGDALSVVAHELGGIAGALDLRAGAISGTAPAQDAAGASWARGRTPRRNARGATGAGTGRFWHTRSRRSAVARRLVEADFRFVSIVLPRGVAVDVRVDEGQLDAEQASAPYVASARRLQGTWRSAGILTPACGLGGGAVQW